MILTSQYVLVLIVVPAVVAALAAFLRFTTMGRMIRAAASNPDAARLAGVSIGRVSMVTWGAAGALAAITAVLQAPSQPSFDASALGPDLLLRALGAAAVGGFTSIAAALAGGIGLGLINQIALQVTSNGGVATLVVFASVLLILVVRSGAISAAVKVTEQRVQESRPLKVPAVLAGRNFVRHQAGLAWGLTLFVALLLPQLPFLRTDSQRFGLNQILIYGLVGISVTMVVGWAGQVSLGHFALVGVGAYLTAKLAPHGVSLPLTVLLAGLLGAAVMALVGLPALRIRGLTLAITTLGFAVIAPAWLFNQSWFGSEQPFGLQVKAPGLGGLDGPSSQIAVYYLALALVGLTVAGGQALRRSSAGRTVFAVRDNEAAALSFGVTPATVKLAVLAVSGFVAGSAGVLWAAAYQSLGVAQFNPAFSLAVLAVPVIGGLGSIPGALAAAAFLYGLSYFVSPHLTAVFGEVGRRSASSCSSPATACSEPCSPTPAASPGPRSRAGSSCWPGSPSTSSHSPPTSTPTSRCRPCSCRTCGCRSAGSWPWTARLRGAARRDRRAHRPQRRRQVDHPQRHLRRAVGPRQGRIFGSESTAWRRTCAPPRAWAAASRTPACSPASPCGRPCSPPCATGRSGSCPHAPAALGGRGERSAGPGPRS